MAATFNLTFTNDNGEVVITSTMILLLNNIQAKGSITAAAKASQLSYKRSWDLLDNMESGLLHPVIVTSIGGIDGGGTRLTYTGIELITQYNELIKTCQDATQQATTNINALLK